jgi:uncharacterized protein with PIN domain
MQNRAVFRFYEELNDFLPNNRKKTAFSYAFEGKPSVKDAIESVGIPHVEVDLILVNGESVDFKYQLRDNDHISVYPVFESLNIAEVSKIQEKPLRNMAFVLDVHLGKLAKYLRMFGFDTVYRNDYDDPEIIQISVDENRVILTRDIGMLKVRTVTRGYFIRDQRPKAQLAEVLKRFDLYKDIAPFSRCIKCNGKLTPVGKNEVMHRLEPMTRSFYNDFFICKSCDSVFWEGSHLDRMKGFIESIRGGEVG